MIVALLICREFDFLKNIIDEAVLEKVNTTLRKNIKFVNEDIAKDVYDNKVDNPHLISDSFFDALTMGKPVILIGMAVILLFNLKNI